MVRLFNGTGKEAHLDWSRGRIRLWMTSSLNHTVDDGFEAIELLAKMWRCPPDTIQYESLLNRDATQSYGLCKDLTDPQALLDLALMFHGCLFYCSNYGQVYRLELSSNGDRCVVVWTPVSQNVRFPLSAGSVKSLRLLDDLKREFDERYDLGFVFSDLTVEGDQYHGQCYEVLQVPEVWAHMYSVEGHFNHNTGTYTASRWTNSYTYEGVAVPWQSMAQFMDRRIREEVSRVILQEYVELFGMTEYDVLWVPDLKEYCLAGMVTETWDNPGPTKYCIVWQSDNGGLILRVRPGSRGLVRCLVEHRGRVIGKSGARITQLAQGMGMSHRLILVD